VYVIASGVIDKFSSTGHYEGQFTPLGTAKGFLSSVVVDQAGNVWVLTGSFSKEAYIVYKCSDALVNECILQWSVGFASLHLVSEHIAVDTSDNLYFPIERKGANGRELGLVEKFSGAGVAGGVEGETDLGHEVSGVTVDLATNDLYASYHEDATGSVSEYEPSGALVQRFGVGSYTESDGIAVNATDKTVYVLANEDGGVVDMYTVGSSPPAPTTDPVSSLTSNSVSLNGELNPGGASESVAFYFEYYKGESCTGGGAVRTPLDNGEGNATVSNTTPVPESTTVTGLQPNTLYTACLVAENIFEHTVGSAVSFTTAYYPPVLTSATASAIAPSRATLTGTVNPHSLSTISWYEYGTSTAYGQSTLAAELGAGSTGVEVPATLENLLPGTTYHYRLVAVNEDSVVYGQDQQFTTTVNPGPLAVTLGASEVAQNTATISGTVNPDGQRTRYEFQVGTDTNYGVSVFFDAGSGDETESVTLTLGGLQPGTTYHYRVVAISEGGTSCGADQTFTTAIFPTATLTAPPTTALLATPPIAFPTPTTSTTTKTTTKKAKSKKKAKAKKKRKAKARK
jgi:hypothetical protein